MIPVSDGCDGGLSRNQNLFRVSKILSRDDFFTSSVHLFISYFSFVIQWKFKYSVSNIRFRNGLVVLQIKQTL